MRADVYIHTSGNAKSRQAAKSFIENGNVLIDGKKVTKPSFEIDETVDHEIIIVDKPRFVSRGGEKLEGAILAFNLDVNGKSCIDIGASTGGFTDCLLSHGAKCVYAVDSGHSQLDPSIADDKRVTSIEKFNARYMTSSDFPHKFDIAVMDVSFISQTLLHRAIEDILEENGYLVSLIKPQFECGKSALNSKGIVKKDADRLLAIHRVMDSATISGFSCIDIIKSPIEGGDGNVEFLMLLQKSKEAYNNITDAKVKSLINQKK